MAGQGLEQYVDVFERFVRCSGIRMFESCPTDVTTSYRPSSFPFFDFTQAREPWRSCPLGVTSVPARSSMLATRCVFRCRMCSSVSSILIPSRQLDDRDAGMIDGIGGVPD